MNFTQTQINDIVAEAKAAAHAATYKYFQEKLGGVDQYACGFAWINIYGVKGNTRLGKMLKAAGVSQDYTRAFQLRNPANMYVQNVETLEAGANAGAEVFRKYGFNAYSGSRLD